jgi:hypothetical protein
VEGEYPPCGVYFVNTADIVENMNANLLIIIPALTAGTYRSEVTTQYTGNSGKFLKTSRTVLFDHLLTVAS